MPIRPPIPVTAIHPSTTVHEVIEGMKQHWPLEGVVTWMESRSSSVTLNWGEDTDKWECSWIVKGKRFTGIACDVRTALQCALELCYEAYGN
jgi:hypothetical protein